MEHVEATITETRAIAGTSVCGTTCSCPRKKSVYVRMMNRNMIIDVQMED
jgi:hypothetical protein